MSCRTKMFMLYCGKGTVVLQGGSLPNLQKKGGDAMGIYEILSLLFLGGTFLVALLTYTDRNNKRK